jgi:hypothetical protein
MSATDNPGDHSYRLRLDPVLFRELQADAADNGMSVNELIVRILEAAEGLEYERERVEHVKVTLRPKLRTRAKLKPTP